MIMLKKPGDYATIVNAYFSKNITQNDGFSCGLFVSHFLSDFFIQIF
jgi:hypothetical protein